MFVRQSTYRKEWMRRVEAEANLDIANAIIKRLTRQQPQAFNAEEVRYLLKVAHPDKNGGAEIATTVTQKLLRMKR